MSPAAAEGAQVFWTARVHSADGETRLASCRYAALDGMTFVCDQPHPIGTEVVMFVAALHGSVSVHSGWIEFRLQVTFQTFTEGLCRITCRHKGTAESSLNWLGMALSRLDKRPHRYGVALAPGLPRQGPEPIATPMLTRAQRPVPLGIEAQRRQLRSLLKSDAGAAPLLAYEGAFDEPALHQLFATARTALASSGVKPGQRRKLYTGVVELAQNIRRHALDGDPQAPQATQLGASGRPLGAMKLLASARGSDGAAPSYSLSAANRIAGSSIEALYTLMHSLRSLGAVARQAALRGLLLEQHAAAGTELQLGFGLLTLAGECAQPLEWSFTTEVVDGEPSYYFVVRLRW